MNTVSGKFPASLVLALLIGGGIAAGQTAYHGTVVEHGGNVIGSVRLQQDGVRPSTESVTKDAAVCGKRKPSPRLLSGNNGGVRNAVVCIEQIVQGKKWDRAGTATLRQRKCEYDPHVLLLKAGDELEIVNEDPILHNVHTYDMNSHLCSVFNIAQPMHGFHTHVQGATLGGRCTMMTTCDAGHPWMSAYIIRESNPYYALTDANGNFRLENVPPGKYVLKMWHEGITASPSHVGPGTPPVVEEPYTVTKEITVNSDASISVDFVLSPRPAVAAN